MWIARTGIIASALGSTLNNNLYAAYNSDSTTNDSLGTYNGTAIGGLTYTTGKIGDAFQFNGTNSRVSLPNNAFDFTGNFSVAMWFRSSDLSTSRYAISNYVGSGGTYGSGWLFYYSSVGGFAFDLRNGATINQVRKIQTINTNTWYHVVAVREVGVQHKLYIDGVDVTAPQTDGSIANVAGYQSLQKNDLGGIADINLYSLCDLGGVYMWNRKITPTEITELYNAGAGKQYTF